MPVSSIDECDRFGGTIQNINIVLGGTAGAHSCILPGSNIPEGAAFGAYTLIAKNHILLPYHLYVGHNCRDLGKREGQELIENFKNRK